MQIVVSDCDHESMKPEEKVFAENGMTFRVLRCRTEEDLIAQCKGVNIVLNQYAPFTPKVFATLKPELRQIVCYGVGVNNIDLDAATASGVQVCNMPDYGVHEVSNHALALILALERKIVFMNERTRGGTWDVFAGDPDLPDFRADSRHRRRRPHRGYPGAQAAAARLSRRRLRPPYGPGSPEMQGAEWVPFDRLVSESDFITLHCPLTPETRDMFDAAVLGRMKRTAFIINTARGGIIDEVALAGALRRGALAGAALDVVEREPLAADSPLRGTDNCLLTPHMAWYSEEAGLELKRKVAEEAVSSARGEPVHYPVNAL